MDDRPGNSSTRVNSVHPVLQYILGRLENDKRMLFRLFLLFLLLGILLTFFLQRKYTAVATVLPSNTESGSLSMLDNLSIGSLLNGSTSAISTQMFPVIMTSDHILRQVLKSNVPDKEDQTIGEKLDSFKAGWFSAFKGGSSERDSTMMVRDMKQMIDLEIDRYTKAAQLKVTHNNPEFAAMVANSILEFTDKYVRNEMRFETTEQLDVINRRIQEISDSLRTTEEELREFRERNRTTLAPSLRLLESRLDRKVQIYSNIYIELSKQRETIKIKEYENRTVLNILDHARTPEEPSSASPITMLLGLPFLGILLGVGFSILRGSHSFIIFVTGLSTVLPGKLGSISLLMIPANARPNDENVADVDK